MLTFSSLKNQSDKSKENSGEKNQGGVLGGLGYVSAGLAAGIGSVGEGIIDLLLAGGGLLTGNVDYAKHVFKDNTVGNWFADVTEDFNPGTGWEFAGNVTHGLGQSSVFLLNLIPGLGQLGTAAFFAGVGSQGISSAAATTGDVGFKEVAYGVASGAVEGALEKAFGGMGKAVKALGGSTMKNITKTAVRKGLVKQVLSDAAGEFGEEFASEYIDTFLQRGFQIDPNKQYSFRDALYAGAVGFTSGAVSAGFANVLKAVGNEREGERVIKNGNSQTLVNTATKVADKLAAQGTNWDRAGEWVKALRGQVDAYNNLSENEKTSMRGKTILGEMKSSLFFAETQSTFDLVKKSIQNSDEQTRATFAEYINRSVEKGKRNGRDYTAADIAKDTDGVAWQLAIYKFVPSLFDLDGAIADMQQEQAIADFVAEKQGAMKRDVVDTEIASAAAGAPAMETTQIANGENVTVPGAAQGARLATVGEEQYDLKEALTTLGDYDADRRRHIESNPNDKISRNYDEIAEFINTASKQNPVKRLHIGVVNPDVADLAKKKANVDITDYDFVIASNFIAHIFDEHGNEKTEAARGQKAVDKSNIEDIIETVIQPDDVSSTTDNQGNKALKFEKDINGRNVAITITSTKKGTLTLKSAWIINKNSGGRTPPASVNTLAGTSKTSDRSSTDNSIHQNESVVNPEEKEISSNDATDGKGKNLRSDAVKVEGEQTGAETMQDETAGASPRPTGEFNGEVDLERAKRDAERIIEWERKEAPTVDELNRVRGAVKNFDYLPSDRQMSIVRMMRTSKNVDEQTVRGLANLMSITNKKGQVLAGDVEIRFADGIGARGVITTTSGGKKVILVDSSAKRSETFRGTIAHELVHYLENRKGYKALAVYAYKIAKNEKIQEVEDLYDRHYKRTFAEEARRANPNATEAEIAAQVEERMSSAEYQELVESEVTASIVGEALKSEKFLKLYAQVGEEKGILKTAARFIKGIFNSTKDKDADLSREAQNLAVLFDRALASEVEREQKSGEKYSFSSIGYSFFGRDDVTIEEFESGAYKKTEGYKAYVAECLSNMRQSRADFNEASAKREIERSIDGIVRVAIAAKNAGYDIYDSAAQRTTKDSKKRLLFSSLEPNSDYFTSSDISTICDKRKNFTEIENEINRIEAERNVPREKRFFADINNFFVLHDILARHGLTTACRQCYVESMRKNLGRMANAFITLVTEENAENKKNAQLYNKNGEIKSGNADLRVKVRELMAEEGIDANYLTFERLTNGENLAEMRLQYPLLYEAYNSFYGQSKPKMPKSATPFRFGELTALLTDDNGKINERLVRQIESTGGFRLQSYSDFQIKNYVDVLQVIFEAGTLGLTGHAYTKVPAFLDATANTNLKRNISIFMYRDGDEWKIDRKDSFPYALDKIYDIVDADKSGDTGIIAVSQNDDMSAWIMANDQIAYGIPFHKSGTKMGVVRETVVYEGKREIKGYTGIKDHTRMQSEVYASGADKGKKVKSPINIYSFWDFDSTRMSKKNLIEKNLKAYIDACEEKGYLPKFRDYVMNNEKVLNSTLEYAKKLGAVGADATVSDISFKYKGYTIPYGYYKFLGDFSMFTPDGKASPHEVLSLKNYDFDAAVNFFSDSKKLRINELLQQLDNGPEREKYRKLINEGKMTITELGRVIKKKRDAVVAEVVDKGEKNVKPSDEKYDLDPEIEAEIEAKYGDNEFFAAAVRRAYEPDSQSAENTRLTKEQLRENAIEKRKRDFNKVIARAVTIQRQIEKMQKQTEGEVDEAKLKKLKKELKTSLGTIGAMQIELRQMGYEVSAEQRRIERLEAQNENQGEQIRTLKQEKRELELAERERHILDMAEKQEKARAAKIAAKQKQEIGKVYSEAEFKRDMQDMMDRGLISKFFGGEYMPHIDRAKNNAIAQYIAIRLNTAGSFEAARKDGIVSVVTNDILRNMYFLDETGEKNYLHSLLDEETMSQFKDMLETDVVSILSNAGELNPYAELMRKFRQLEGEYKTKLAKNNEGEAWGKEFPKVVAEAKRMRNFAINKKGMAADGVQEVLKAFATLTDESGRLYSGRVDSVMQAALTFFEAEAMRTNSERGQVKDENKVADDSMIWNIDPDLKDAIELFVQMRKGREGTLMNSQELKLVREILSGMRTSLERYNKEKIGGRFVDIDTAAGEKVRFMQTDVESKTFTSKLLNSKLGRAFRNAYFYEVLSPATVFESLDGYEIGGLLTTLYRDIRMAAQSAIDMKARLKDPFVRYVDDKENAWKDEKGHSRSYRQKLNEKKISVDGVNITLGEAINLYMLTKREHAHLGLKEGGFVTYDENGVKVAKIKIPDIEIARNNLYNQFDATDRKFIEMAEDFFNKTASKIKEDADIEIYGYSKNSEGYYVPIVRDHYSRNNGVTDVRQSISNFATVNNKSFTKDLVRNAKPLEGQNILGLIETHADGLADYANLYMPLKAFDRVYNRGVSIDGGEVTTLREQLNEEWNGAHKYFTKLFKDIQGVRDGDPPSNVDKVASWIRSNWVASVLGANLKVVCTQTTSLGAATQIIDAKYVTKASWIITPGTGFAKGVKEIAERADKYSKTIFSRSFDAGAVKAQGNLDKIGNIAKGASTLIGIQDRKVCIALFHAAELSVEASTGHKVGTEENSVLAAKLVDEAILTTQAMESQAEKSNLQRANSELAKLFSMFTSDSVKNLSHLISNISRYAAHKNRAKNGDARYEAELKKDGKAARRSMRTMLITGVMLGVITQGFKYLYGKEEEDEKKLQDFGIDIVSSTINVFPIASEIIDKLVFDYDMSVNVLDVVNDTLETFGDSFELMGKAMGGEYVSGQAIGKSAINLSKSAFSLFGIPVAPAERTVTGLLRRFSPGTIYGYDSMMYSATYSADLKAAVESGDDALAEHILETIYKNESTGVYSTPELEEVARLYGLGNTSVIPQKIGATVNDVKLDRKQRAQFESIYSQASAKVNELIRSEYYAELDDGQRAKAIKNLYLLYYNRAAAEVAGVEWSNAQAYSRLTDNYAALFAAQSYKSGLSPYKTLRGKEVSVKDQFVKYVENLGLSDADKLVVLYANGYRDAKTKKKMLAYINSLSISEEEKTRIAERLGFAIENGKVVEKKEELEVRAE